MIYKIVIPARANSKRLPGKNMRILGDKPLIQHSIDFALNNLPPDSIWVNSDDKKIIEFAKKKGVRTLLRPDNLATDFTSTVDVLKFQVNYFRERNIYCDAIILLQPTNPLRQYNLLEIAINKFEKSRRKSLATFSVSGKKTGTISNNFFKPTNYTPGQRSQDLEKTYFENGLLYITDLESILIGKVITECVYPLVCDEVESSVDIDYLEDFIFAESLLKLKK
jgi:CMP-N-acetylneuraminic acid synthetase